MHERAPLQVWRWSDRRDGERLFLLLSCDLDEPGERKVWWAAELRYVDDRWGGAFNVGPLLYDPGDFADMEYGGALPPPSLLLPPRPEQLPLAAETAEAQRRREHRGVRAK